MKHKWDMRSVKKEMKSIKKEFTNKSNLPMVLMPTGLWLAATSPMAGPAAPYIGAAGASMFGIGGAGMIYRLRPKDHVTNFDKKHSQRMHRHMKVIGRRL